MAKDFHNDPLFKVLKEYFRVNLFYKPSMIDMDVRYHVVLDSQIIIQFQVVATDFLVIDNIVPMTTEYIPKTYDDLVKCLMNQTEFSVMIFRLGNTTVIDNACVNNNVPIVLDEKFITIPKKLYSMYLRLHQKNTDMCGFYLLALNGDLDSIEIITPTQSTKQEPKPKPIKKEILTPEPVEEDIPVVNTNRAIDIIVQQLISLFSTAKLNYEGDVICFQNDMFTMNFQLNGAVLELTNFSQLESGTSGIEYMKFFATLEKMLHIIPISIINVKSKILDTICQTRGYDKIVGTYTLNQNQYGSYAMKTGNL